MFNIFFLSILLSVSLSNSSLKKKRTRSIFSSLFCCLRSYDAEPPATPNNSSSPLSPPVEENGASPKVRRPNIVFTQGVITVNQMRIDSETSASLSHRHVWLNRSHHNSLSLFFCADCITFVWIIVHLSCGSAPHFLSCLFFISHVPVWPGWGHPYPQCMYDSSPCRLSVCSRMPHGALHHCTLQSTFEAALWTVMHFAWWMLACAVYYTISEAPGKPNVFPQNYRLRHFQHVLAMPTLLLFNCWEYDCFSFDNASVFPLYSSPCKASEQNVLH